MGYARTQGRKFARMQGRNSKRAFINRIINSNSFKRAIRFSGVTRLLDSSTIRARLIMFNSFPLGDLQIIITIFLYSAFILLQNRLLNLNKKKYINSWHKNRILLPPENLLEQSRPPFCSWKPASTHASRNTRNCILAASPSILAYLRKSECRGLKLMTDKMSLGLRRV